MQNTRRWTARRVVLGAVLLYLGYVGLAFAFQRCLVFPEWKRSAPNVDGATLGYERLAVGEDVEAWFLPADRGTPSPVVIFGHGNAEFVSDWFEALTPYSELGVGVLLVEYPGYGEATGDPSEDSIEHALLAAYDAVVERADVDETRTIVHGRSIGGGAVCQLIENRPVRAAILESTFAELSQLAWRFLIPSFLVRDPFDNVDVIAEFDGPVLVMHGSDDSLVPIDNGRELADAAGDSRFVELDCGHNDCVRDEDGYWAVVEQFLADSGILAPTASE